jgi:nicotinamide-nucleotide amidase
MKAELITIGDEILIGQIVDTNSAWMATHLNSIGIGIAQITSISDSPGHLVKALNEAKKRADVILITGGLGPTKDDRTKKVLAEYFNSKLVMHKETLEFIKYFFKQRGLGVNQLNSDQALVPECCEVLFNTSGTAPGMWFEEDGKIFVSMPGVPYEMKSIMKTHVLPRLKVSNGNEVIYHKTVLTQGIPESILAEKLSDWEDALPDHIHLAYLPNPGQIRLRFSAFGSNSKSLKAEVKDEIEKLFKIIPEAIFGYDNDTLASVTGKLLADRNATLATAESCTGGYIAHQITSIPGSSDWYKGSIIAYSNEIKTNILNVPPHIIEQKGAVSSEVVAEMASRVRILYNTDFAIATSGIAGPNGGTENKPVGTVWIAVASANNVETHKFNFANNRERNIIRSSQTALNLLRLALLK